MHKWIKGFLDWASIRPKRRSNPAQPAPYPLLTHTGEEASRETGSRWRRWVGTVSGRRNRFSTLLGSSCLRAWVGECRWWAEGDWACLLRGMHSFPEEIHKENPLSLIHKFKRWFTWSRVFGGALVLLETQVVCYLFVRLCGAEPSCFVCCCPWPGSWVPCCVVFLCFSSWCCGRFPLHWFWL
jgi:hypothetical protein